MLPFGQHDDSQLHHEQRDHVKGIARCGIEYINRPHIYILNVFASVKFKI